MSDVDLRQVKKTDPALLAAMENHYSKPRGFVGRQIIYSVESSGVQYGFIAGGSATLNLPGRDNFLQWAALENIVNNTFFSIKKIDGKYPCRNFASKVVLEFEKNIQKDWIETYSDVVIGIETLVEIPRTGELYRRAGYTHVGTTKGFTCKRIAGDGNETWGGRRVWSTGNPKLVFCKLLRNVDV